MKALIKKTGLNNMENPNGQAGSNEMLRQEIIKALREVYDPEITVNLYDLGLIYEVNILEDRIIQIVMTLTTPSCPVAEMIPGQVENRVKFVEGVKDVQVKLVWDPPWNRDMMTEEAKLDLGLF